MLTITLFVQPEGAFSWTRTNHPLAFNEVLYQDELQRQQGSYLDSNQDTAGHDRWYYRYTIATIERVETRHTILRATS